MGTDKASKEMTPDEAVARIRQLRAEQQAEGVRVTHEEIIAWKDEGRDRLLPSDFEMWHREDARRGGRREAN